MSDPIQNFEFILKKQSAKQGLGLYSDNKQLNKHSLKPQDVITSVSLQLKAIQDADSLKSEKTMVKDFQKYKKSNFLSVNKLPVYEEVPKPSTKFETQCVSDTQLINIIEDAEIIDVHRGMTQEFETTFSHYTEKQTIDDNKTDENVHIKDNPEVSESIQTGTDKDITYKPQDNITEVISDSKLKSMNNNIDNSVTLISSIMFSNKIVDEVIGIISQDSKKDETTQFQEFNQLIHECIEIEDEADMVIERPVSPIFLHKHVKTKSKTPSPLIFNLDKFEQFEKIAIPILEKNDMETAKHVINSQILDKELNIRMDEEIQLNEREVLSPLLKKKNAANDPVVDNELEFKTHISEDSDTDLEFIELDKATSEDLINKIINKDSNANLKVKTESEILKDEILFSSDEEDNYVQKSLQDLPFTCALETSFYDQTDVLDKTMYVGFQTASNKTIQIFSESYAQAQSFLSDVASDEITVSDLVKNCDSNAENKTQDAYENQMDLNSLEKEFDLAQDGKELGFSIRNTSEKTKDISLNNKQAEAIFEGFMTASKKEIILSQKALARCKKVFQDIDFNEDFDTHVEKGSAQSRESCEEKVPVVTKTLKANVNKTFADDDLQNIDDVIIQEFENVEMPLNDDSETDTNVTTIGFKTASNKDIQISETALTKTSNFFKDIDFDEDLNELDNEEDNVLLKVIEDLKLSNNENNIAAFKTAGDKNISISKEALAKTKNIFQDIDSTEFPNKSSNCLDKGKNLINLEQPSTSKASFVGFKTANNRNIKISEQTLVKTKCIFQDIDSTEFPKKKSKDLNENLSKDNVYDQPSTSKNFVGFNTANNKDIKISYEALVKTKKIFEDLDSTDLKLQKIYIKHFVDTNIPKKTEELLDFSQPSTSTASFVGFKTANNKNINISDTALAKTKNIFKDLDSADFKFPDKGCRDGQTEKLNNKKTVEVETVTFNVPAAPTTAKSSFTGFKTANNNDIKTSDAALANTKNTFKNIDSDNFRFSSTLDKKIQENIEETGSKSSYGVKLTDLNKPSTSTVTFTGFKTANNKQINISEAALSKTKQIFKDIDSADFKFPQKGNKHLQTTESIEETKKTGEQMITDDTQDFNRPSTSKAGYKSSLEFKAANIRKNNSKEYLATTKNIFKHIDKTDFQVPEKVYNNDLDKLLLVERNKVCKENSVYETEMIDFHQPSASITSFVGFKTANNKKIGISKESLAKTNYIFKDIDTNDFVYPMKRKNELDETRTHIKNANPDLKNKQPQTSKSFVGFKTANNKVMKVSETALAKTKNIFKDLDSTEFQLPKKATEDYPEIEKDFDEIESDLVSKNKTTVAIDTNNDFKVLVTAVPKFQGFHTASNKEVKISADALVKSKKIFQNIDVSQDFNANSKSIEATNVCKENNILGTIKDYLDDNKGMDDDAAKIDSRPSPVFKGFQTANKKHVTISKQSLAISRKLFQDIDTIDEEDPEPALYGFKTANNNVVEVSERALIETKKLFDDKIKEFSSIKGFQTASDKKVVVSEDSLAKSRKIFKDVENFGKNENRLRNNDKITSKRHFGFKTGTNRDVVVTEDSIARSKRLFSEIDNSNDNITKNKKDKRNEENISNIIDTQVLNNFEESLHTEDFHDTPIKSKRSGSPILSCPRAKKKKKFETPYSQNLPKPEKKRENIKDKNDNNITYDVNYKKNKKYSLKDLKNLTKNNTETIDPYLLQFNFDNLLQFEFYGNRNGLSNGNMTIDLLKQLFQNSVNSKLIPNGWLDNHLKLILWKLISYEIKFKSITCSARNVLDQLKYRYDKELYNAQRAALRKILEKDDVASKTMVLCVAGVYEDGVNVVSATTANNIELLLTDGWYCIRANIDKMLAQLVCQGKIVVGTKIVTNGAELVNCEQGVSPWEDTSAVRLKLFGNSTRRANWDARLGYHGNGAILSQLSSVRLDGGKVSKLRVLVTRVYPALYVEKFDDGSTVTRSERLELLHQMKSEAERQAVIEKIYEEVEREFSDQESQDSEGLSDLSNKRTCLDSGSQIAKVMKRSKDPSEFRAGLTSSQTRLLEDHTSKKREVLLQDIHQRIRDKIEKAGVCVNRNVVTLLKIRVAGVKESSGVEVTKGMMSIWKPTDAVLEIIKEGAWIDVMNVVPTAVRYSEIQISAGRQSVFSTSKYIEPDILKPYTKLLKRTCFGIKDLAQNPSMATDYNEIDTVGLIFLIDPSIQEFDSNKQPFQNVFLADADKNMICINFWGGLKKFGFQNVLDTGQLVSCVNLQKRAGNTRKSIQQYRVTEFSYFTKTPKNENARNMLDDLSKKFLCLDRRKFCEDCVVLKNNYSVLKYNNENISPYRFNNCDFNMSKNKMFIDSPLARPNKVNDNFNLTGLDFESTFKQTDTQNLPEEVLLRKKKVNEKIARLKMYGEPPPLTTIHIINRSKNASSSYKSPLISNNDNAKNIHHRRKCETKLANSKSDSSIRVASIKETSEKFVNLNESDVVCSPVLMNRTYIKNVNPVKIDFDVKDNNDSNVDHFAEDFDGSPPLSLD